MRPNFWRPSPVSPCGLRRPLPLRWERLTTVVSPLPPQWERARVRALFLPLLLLISACAPTPRTTQPADTANISAPTEQRTLTIVMRVEPSEGITEAASSLNRISLALFSAYLGERDNRENAYPILAASIPQLNTDSWRLLPDGRMETTFKLRPNLAWHDGQPLTADDVAFGFRVQRAKIEWGLTQPFP